MVTITELLTEVFNRVKSEHGVVLSRVDFTTGYGALADIEFVGTGCSTPVAAPAVHNGPQPPVPYTGDEMSPREICVKDEVFVISGLGYHPPKSSLPAVVSHIDGYGVATVSWPGMRGIFKYPVGALTHTNPTSQSAADSDS